MKNRPFKLTLPHKRSLYGISSVLFLSGALWWLADVALARMWPGHDFERGAKPWLLKIHGGAAMAFLFLVGTLWPNHIRLAWRFGQNRKSGVILLAWLAALTTSGYGLYYFGGEQVREWTATLHDWAGLLAAAVLAAHVWLGHRTTRPPSRTVR